MLVGGNIDHNSCEIWVRMSAHSTNARSRDIRYTPLSKEKRKRPWRRQTNAIDPTETSASYLFVTGDFTAGSNARGRNAVDLHQ